MLWMGICEVVSVAIVSGLIGGCLMAISQRASNRFNMKMMEEYWNADIKRLESELEIFKHKLSTFSVSKPVNNAHNSHNNKGYKNQRHFNQRG